MLIVASGMMFPLISVSLPKISYMFPIVTFLGSASTVMIAVSLSAVISLNSVGVSSSSVLESIPVLFRYVSLPLNTTCAYIGCVESIPRPISSKSIIFSPFSIFTCFVVLPMVMFNVPFTGFPSTSVTVTFNVTFPTVLLTIYTVVFVGILLTMNVVLLVVAPITSFPMKDTLTV